MLKGIHLTLFIGPSVPVPVPQVVLDALTSVQVVTSAREASGFELQFTLSNQSPLPTLFLRVGNTPFTLVRVIIVITVNGAPEVLMDGVMTHHQIAPGSGNSSSTLTIQGQDLSAVMDLIDFSGDPYPAMPPEARVAQVLAKYAGLGIRSLVIPRVLTEVPIPVERFARHQGKDLGYIQQLADEAGYVFFIDPGPLPGVSTAYWGPDRKADMPQPALNINMDAYTNVESLTFSFMSEERVLPRGFIQDPRSKAPLELPAPDITVLNPPLGQTPTLAKTHDLLSDTAKLSPVEARLRGLARASRSADVVMGNGNLDVLRYGRVLKARQPVTVRGAGPAFDGLYYVESATHSIKRGEYKEAFTLSSNSLH